jgi:CRISPR-associated endonuclease Csn1
MLLEKWDREDKDFTPGDLTRTSHLMRLGAQRIVRWFGWNEGDAARDQIRSDHRIISLPGQVTAEVRKAWHVTGCLIPACPEVAAPTTHHGHKPKKDIRDITHLHHALDACVMGLAAALMPNNGKLWEQIANRKVREEELPAFHAQRRDQRLYRLGGKEGRTQKLELADLPEELKNQITARLSERRVVQRVPADMSGALLEETTWAIEKKDQDSDRLTLSQRAFDKKDTDQVTGARKRKSKPGSERAGKVLGLRAGRLQHNLGIRIIAGNYGLALFDPKLKQEPKIIPHHQVWQRLQELKAKNGGRAVRVLKNGMLIRVKTQPKRAKTDYTGVWRIFSVKNNEYGIALDIARPERVKPENKVPWAGINVGIKALLEAGLEILPSRLTGVPS